VDVAVLIIHPWVGQKIRTKHAPLTAEDIRSAVIYGRDVVAGWQDHEKHGRRLVVKARTLGGIEFIAFLLPLDENDPEEGTFILKTAYPNPFT
jgi:hypothetical protein